MHQTQSHRSYLSRISSVIVSDSGDIGESIYQHKGWKQQKQKKQKKQHKTRAAFTLNGTGKYRPEAGLKVRISLQPLLCYIPLTATPEYRGITVVTSLVRPRLFTVQSTALYSGSLGCRILGSQTWNSA